MPKKKHPIATISNTNILPQYALKCNLFFDKNRFVDQFFF